MNQDNVIIGCSSCGTKNRVPKERLRDHPICGKCKATLSPESVIVQCAHCGAKNRVYKALLHDDPKCGKCHEQLQTIPRYDRPLELTDRTFGEEVLSFPAPVLMEYYSPMCAYCKTLDPILEQLASEYAGRLKIGKLNIDQNPHTASRYDVMSTPTLIFYKDGQLVNRLVGTVPKQEIENHLRYILANP